ncbi:MAG: glycosyltransferase family 4 protein [Actinomycetota bacterium]|nr:glycosyltransferase family 4 protein [Actinomycetota bacterium]
MKLAFVVQRYGLEVAGGAERHCREFAERLVERGHEVTVLTNCARSYVDWSDDYEPGDSVVNGVTVRRLRVVRPRDAVVFDDLNARVAWGRPPVASFIQREWMRQQGPEMDGYEGALLDLARSHDVVIFFTYLYSTTFTGLLLLAGRVPTVLHPTLHDEAPAYASIYRQMFRMPTLFALSTPEEVELVERIYGVRPRHRVIGVGVDLAIEGQPDRFRKQYALTTEPYLLYVGRLDPGKGSDELFDFFAAYKIRRPGPLKLVVLGDPIKALPAHPDVIVTGFVDDEVRNDALLGAQAFVQPSYFESFSMVVSEALSAGLPVLVQAHCEVLAGHVARSGAGFAYRGYAEFETAVDILLAHPELVAEFGRRGRAYVEREYAWETVMDRYESALSEAFDLGAEINVESAVR